MPSSINKGSWTRNLFRISFSKIKYCKSIFRMKKSKIYENKHLWKRPLYLYLNFWYLSNFLVFFVILLFNSFNSSRSSSDWDSSFSLPNSVRNFLYLFSSFTYSAPPLFSLKNDSSALNDPTFQHRRNNWTSYKHVKILPDWATMIGFLLLSFIWFLGFIFLFDFISWFFSFFWKSYTYQGELWYLTRTTTEMGTGSDDCGARDRATVLDDRSKIYDV